VPNVFGNQSIVPGSQFSVVGAILDGPPFFPLRNTSLSVYKISSINADTKFFHSRRCRIQSSI
jgi:hypothetical protein